MTMTRIRKGELLTSDDDDNSPLQGYEQRGQK